VDTANLATDVVVMLVEVRELAQATLEVEVDTKHVAKGILLMCLDGNQNMVKLSLELTHGWP